jgi:hypothetical protein
MVREKSPESPDVLALTETSKTIRPLKQIIQEEVP